VSDVLMLIWLRKEGLIDRRKWLSSHL